MVQRSTNQSFKQWWNVWFEITTKWVSSTSLITHHAQRNPPEECLAVLGQIADRIFAKSLATSWLRNVFQRLIRVGAGAPWFWYGEPSTWTSDFWLTGRHVDYKGWARSLLEGYYRWNKRWLSLNGFGWKAVGNEWQKTPKGRYISHTSAGSTTFFGLNLWSETYNRNSQKFIIEEVSRWMKGTAP